MKSQIPVAKNSGEASGIQYDSKWVPGKSHYIADVPSRAPLLDSHVPDEDKFTIDTAQTCLIQLVEKNHKLKLFLDSLDADYSHILQCLFFPNEVSFRPVER